MSALANQIGGEHYKSKGIQPVEFIHSNNLTFIEGNVIKYVWRWRDKGGIADLEKAKHYIEMLIELEGKHDAVPPVAEISVCDNCGAEYPSAPIGTIHKCARCSGGTCVRR
jgi:hypothetical protein